MCFRRQVKKKGQGRVEEPSKAETYENSVKTLMTSVLPSSWAVKSKYFHQLSPIWPGTYGFNVFALFHPAWLKSSFILTHHLFCKRTLAYPDPQSSYSSLGMCSDDGFHLFSAEYLKCVGKIMM